jgi:lysophospholipase L1-like esterase
VSAAGDHAAEAESGAFTAAIPSWYYLSGLLVQSPGAAGTVVAFGDSITDGVASAIGTNHRWPNDLARRLDGLAGTTLAVADAGIGGNRVLAGSGNFGASALARFARDVLDQPGVRDIIVLEGINDIGFGAGRLNSGPRSARPR